MRIRLDWKFFSLLSVLAIAAAIIVAIVLGVQSMREIGTRASSRRNLMIIANALHSYHHEHGCFPPAHVVDEQGKPMRSWRTLLLPYLDDESRYSRYRLDEPWNSPANLSLSKPMHMTYAYPTEIDPGKTTTNYVAVVGVNTMWLGREPAQFVPGRSDFDKILIIEILNSDIHWMEPRDLTIEEALDAIEQKKRVRTNRFHRSGVNCITVAGRLHILDRDIDPESLRRLLIRNSPNDAHGGLMRTERTPRANASSRTEDDATAKAAKSDEASGHKDAKDD